MWQERRWWSSTAARTAASTGPLCVRFAWANQVIILCDLHILCCKPFRHGNAVRTTRPVHQEGEVRDVRPQLLERRQLSRSHEFGVECAAPLRRVCKQHLLVVVHGTKSKNAEREGHKKRRV